MNLHDGWFMHYYRMYCRIKVFGYLGVPQMPQPPKPPIASDEGHKRRFAILKAGAS